MGVKGGSKNKKRQYIYKNDKKALSFIYKKDV